MPATPSKDRTFHDASIIAVNELQDALRSRRGMVVLVLFLAAAIGGTLLSIAFIHSVERSLARALMLEPTEGTGSMTATLWKNQNFRKAVTDMVDDPDLAESLLSAPPLSLFFCGIVFFLSPMLVAMTSSHRLTEDVWTGASRFVLFRTSRLSWCLGKYAGQGAVLLIALLASVPAAWACGWFRMEDYPSWATLVSMTGFALKAWVYALAFLGLVTGVSLFVRSPGVATAVGVLGVAALSIQYHVAGRYSGEGWRMALELPRLLTPQAYQVDLLRPDWRHALPAVASVF